METELNLKETHLPQTFQRFAISWLKTREKKLQKVQSRNQND